jgi:hypothetical protein
MVPNAALIIATNSGHTSWWIGLPVLAVVFVARMAFWRSRRGRYGRGGRRGRGGDSGNGLP